MRARDHLRKSITLIAFLLVSQHATPVSAQGTFTGQVVAEWLTGQSPERDMRLLEPFTFTDAKGKVWHVPAGATIDGASIPQALWSLAGSPFTGNYRRASVVHDYFCEKKTESWEDVHRMFYHAMVAGKMPEIDAKIYYAFVYAGGPRWKTIVTKRILEGAEEALIIPMEPKVPQRTQEEINFWIKSENPSIEAIEQRVNSQVIVQ